MLTSIELSSALTDTRLARAFCHLAFVEGLEELSISPDLLGDADMELQAAIVDVASLCYKGSGHIRGSRETLYREFKNRLRETAPATAD